MWRVGSILLAFGLLAGCGGRGLIGNTSPSDSPSPGSSPSAPTANSSTTFGRPVIVAAGQSLTGVDVVVTQPASKTLTNAEDLGVNSVGAQGMASNTGGTIRRGSTMRILLFGPGLNGGMTVSVGGPADITITDVKGIQATDNTPGVAFVATVAPNASLGARTVLLRSINGDTTSFTGGLEVLP